MWTTLLALFSLTQAHAPLPATLPLALVGQDLCVALQATASAFAVENLGLAPQLVLFEERSVGYRSARILGPRERVWFTVPDDVAPTLRMEAFEGLDPLGRSTGSFRLDDLRARGARAVFGVAGAGGLQLVADTADGLSAVEAGPSMYPGIAHVPVPVPSADRKGPSKRIEKRPLPPV